MERFEPRLSNPFHSLLAQKQDNLEQEYVTKFDKYAGSVQGLGE